MFRPKCVEDTQKSCLNKMVLLSTQNITLKLMGKEIFIVFCFKFVLSCVFSSCSKCDFFFSVTKRTMCLKRERMVSQEVDQEVGVEQGKLYYSRSTSINI